MRGRVSERRFTFLLWGLTVVWFSWKAAEVWKVKRRDRSRGGRWSRSGLGFGVLTERFGGLTVPTGDQLA